MQLGGSQAVPYKSHRKDNLIDGYEPHTQLIACKQKMFSFQDLDRMAGDASCLSFSKASPVPAPD